MTCFHYYVFLKRGWKILSRSCKATNQASKVQFIQWKLYNKRREPNAKAHHQHQQQQQQQAQFSRPAVSADAQASTTIISNHTAPLLLLFKATKIHHPAAGGKSLDYCTICT
ncbi:hypothetical protein T06_13872 [Trichinella sp. T6]|nr:hypothetical protein T06_13872 [Trichinella sp. T6]